MNSKDVAAACEQLIKSAGMAGVVLVAEDNAGYFNFNVGKDSVYEPTPENEGFVMDVYAETVEDRMAMLQRIGLDLNQLRALIEMANKILPTIERLHENLKEQFGDYFQTTGGYENEELPLPKKLSYDN